MLSLTTLLMLPPTILHWKAGGIIILTSMAHFIFSAEFQITSRWARCIKSDWKIKIVARWIWNHSPYKVSYQDATAWEPSFILSRYANWFLWNSWSPVSKYYYCSWNHTWNVRLQKLLTYITVKTFYVQWKAVILRFRNAIKFQSWVNIIHHQSHKINFFVLFWSVSVLLLCSTFYISTWDALWDTFS